MSAATQTDETFLPLVLLTTLTSTTDRINTDVQLRNHSGHLTTRSRLSAISNNPETESQFFVVAREPTESCDSGTEPMVHEHLVSSNSTTSSVQALIYNSNDSSSSSKDLRDLKRRQSEYDMVSGEENTSYNGIEVVDALNRTDLQRLSTGNFSAPVTSVNQLTEVNTSNQPSPVATGNWSSPMITNNWPSPLTTGNWLSPVITGHPQSSATAGNQLSPVITGNLRSPATAGNRLSPLTMDNLLLPVTTGNRQSPVITGNQLLLPMTTCKQMIPVRETSEDCLWQQDEQVKALLLEFEAYDS